MKHDSTSEELAILSAGLSAARRRVFQQQLAVAFSRGVDLAMKVLLICSIAMVGYSVYRIAAGLDWRMDSRIVYGTGAFILFVIVAHILHAAAIAPDDVAVAERLDAAAHNHNRIATAFDLLKQSDSSPMARAAIADGIAAVAEARQSPVVDAVPWQWQRWMVLTAIAAGAWLMVPLAMRIDWRGEPKDSSGPLIASISNLPADQSKNADAPEPPPPVQKSPPSDPPVPTGSPGVATAAAPPTGPAQSASSSGASGGASAGKSGTGEPASGADSKKQSTTPSPEKKENPSKPSTGSGMGGGVQGAATGSVGAGGKGGGGKALALENESRRQDAAELESGDDAGGDPAEPDENNENRHRGGAQPLMQDRAQSPTRELGIGGLKGSPGTGRGGPTPTKKARGAGALMLGVPIPDFVPGRLLAGTSKMSRETIKPRRTELPPLAPGATDARTEDESVIERFDVSPEDAAALTQYLKELHHEDATAPAATQPSLPAGAISP